jgi:NTE family protein
LRAAAAYHTDDLSLLDPNGLILGFQGAYFYNTIIGPIGASIGYTSLTHSPYFYINIGHIF